MVRPVCSSTRLGPRHSGRVFGGTMTLANIRDSVAARLPARYDHLKLTFYGKESRLQGEYVVIGDGYGTNLCARLNDGSIYSIDPQRRLETCFVNSSIEQLARFIEASESFAGTTLDNESLARGMQAALAAIDDRAFTESPNWWGQVLEGVSRGL